MADAKIGPYTEQTIKITDLELDTQNPRTGKHASQADALNAMLNRKTTYIDDMAASIVRNGFLSLELACVYPSKKTGKYVVAEGNRRVTALKVLQTPDLARTSKKHAKFKQLSQSVKGKLPASIKCAVFKNAKDCEPYVHMRHELGNDKASLRVWDPLERRRVAETKSGSRNQALNVLDFVIDQGDLSAYHVEQLGTNISITNLERLTDSAAVRKILEVDKADSTISAKGIKWITPVWQRIVEIILDEKHLGKPFSVKNIYNKDDQEAFIWQVLHEVHRVPLPAGTGSGTSPAKGAPAGKGGTAKGGKGAAAKKGSKGSKSATTTKQRTGLVDKSFSPAKLAPQKIVNLVEELKGLSAEKFANCSGVMFRVIMELTIHHYMATHSIKGVDAKGKDLPEKAKRQAVIKHLKQHSAHGARAFKALEDTINDKHPVSAQSLNFYVHSKTHSPTGITLKTEWDNLQHIFEIIWEV